MIIKKYQANTEQDAMLLVREELGKDAIVMNIKKISPKGFYRIFRKPSVEVTAAIDEMKKYSSDTKEDANKAFVKKEEEKKEDKTDAIEEKINKLASLIETQMNNERNIKLKEAETKEEVKETAEEEKKLPDKSEECLNLIIKQLKKHEVDEKYIDEIIGEVRCNIKKDTPVDNILTSIYQKIVLKLGQPKIIEVGDKNPKFIFFVGPTGVGKTTTIAKIASDFKINKKYNIALLTTDTYRIAAVEQLRVYANILKLPITVVYTPEEILRAKEELEKYDVVLIDTAGRNHKNKEQRNDLLNFINAVEEEKREVFLVLSATTKYVDLKNIVNSYAEINNYRLLFTKTDETINFGNILNVKMFTNADLSYVAYGQDVPNDIGKLDSQLIAKQLLGGE
ncbi:MAG: flagellar biosynthesis protein FlhF [Lachnospiraceae bacterium]|nr:flagellar biosynthesis protein FlhF [Lachnospiraceae bacterium]